MRDEIDAIKMEKKILLAFSLLYFAFVFFCTDLRARYFSAIIPPLLLNSLYIFGQYRVVAPFSYLTGKVSREQYIENYRQEYPAMSYINANLPSNALILFIFLGNRGYYCDRDYVFDMINNKSTLGKLIRSSAEPDMVFLDLRRMGITHLLIHLDIFKRWAKNSFDPRDQALLDRFFEDHLRLIYLKSGVGLFQVMPLTT
jgi:hypothetical protein